MAEGGVCFHGGKGEMPVLPTKVKLLACERQDDVLMTRWHCRCDDQEAEVTYTLRLWQKSLVVDVTCAGGVTEEVRFGRAVGLDRPRLVTLPYLAGGSQRPAVLVSGPAERPLFTMGLVDHTRSSASELWF